MNNNQDTNFISYFLNQGYDVTQTPWSENDLHMTLEVALEFEKFCIQSLQIQMNRLRSFPADVYKGFTSPTAPKRQIVIQSGISQKHFDELIAMPEADRINWFTEVPQLNGPFTILGISPTTDEEELSFSMLEKGDF